MNRFAHLPRERSAARAPSWTRFAAWAIRWGSAVVLLLLLAIPFSAEAACTISVGTMGLGTYTGVTSTSGATPISVNCAKGSSYNILMGFGTGLGAMQTAHKVTGPSSKTLTYGLYRDSAHTAVWGQTINTNTYKGTGTGAVQTIYIYPQTPGAQTGPAGTYTDMVLLAVSGDSYASTSFAVTATIPPICTISATSLQFGSYINVLLTATATITAKCTSATSYNVGLGAGNGSGATVTSRRMQGSDTKGLKYALYRNSSRTLNWGNTVGTDTVAGSGSGSAQTLTVYGAVAAGQNIGPSSYADTIVVTLFY